MITKSLQLKLIITLFTFFYGINLTFAQGFSLSDTNTIFKTVSGHVLSKDSLYKLLAKPFSMRQDGINKNGKNEITITPFTKEDSTKKDSTNTAWINTWKGKTLPEFMLEGMDKKQYSNNSLKGKITVMSFWFLACKACIQEMPQLNKLVDYYKDQPVQFLAPCLDAHQAVQNFLSKQPFNYMTLVNAKVFADKMEVPVYPTHLIIDETQTIREVIIGASETIDTDIKNAITKIQNTSGH